MLPSCVLKRKWGELMVLYRSFVAVLMKGFFFFFVIILSFYVKLQFMKCFLPWLALFVDSIQAVQKQGQGWGHCQQEVYQDNVMAGDFRVSPSLRSASVSMKELSACFSSAFSLTRIQNLRDYKFVCNYKRFLFWNVHSCLRFVSCVVEWVSSSIFFS